MMLNRYNKQRRTSTLLSSGSVVIELSVLIALLATFALGIADASEAFRIKHVLQIATREGARLASVTPGLNLDPSSTSANRVRQVINDILTENHVKTDPAITTVTITEAVGGAAPVGVFTAGDPVQISAIYHYTPVFLGTIPGWFGGAFSGDLRSSTTMRYEG